MANYGVIMMYLAVCRACQPVSKVGSTSEVRSENVVRANRHRPVGVRGIQFRAVDVIPMELPVNNEFRAELLCEAGRRRNVVGSRFTIDARADTGETGQCSAYKYGQ